MILDTDSPEQVFGEEDDVDQILEQLYPGLNFLEICTDRPQYFAAFADRMEHECGLIVRILPLAEMHQSRAGISGSRVSGSMRLQQAMCTSAKK